MCRVDPVRTQTHSQNLQQHEETLTDKQSLWNHRNILHVNMHKKHHQEAPGGFWKFNGTSQTRHNTCQRFTVPFIFLTHTKSQITKSQNDANCWIIMYLRFFFFYFWSNRNTFVQGQTSVHGWAPSPNPHLDGWRDKGKETPVSLLFSHWHCCYLLVWTVSLKLVQ